MELSGRVAVVTGGGSGIGRALSLAFGAAGCAGVVVADVDGAAAVAVAGEVEAAGSPAIGLTCDVGDPNQVELLREATLERFGAVHVLCNNAGILRVGAAWESTLEEWDATLTVNVWGVVNGIRSFVPHFLEQGEGHVVNTASHAGLTSNPGLAAYNVSKHAVVALSETLHRDLAISGADGVKVSVVCPAFVATAIADDPVTRAGRTDVARLIGDVMVASIPTSMDPAEVAAAVVDAVRAERFWVLTHPEQTLPRVEERLADILQGRPPGTAVPEG